MKPRTTLRDIAGQAGLSISTVSLALRNEGTISPTTCAHIQKLARQMGYVPNPVIAAMASKRTGGRRPVTTPVAVIWKNLFDEKTPAVEPLAQKRARELGYRLELFRLEPGRELTLSRTLFNRGFVGIVLNVLYGYDRLPDFEWEHFSVIKRGRDFFPVPFHTVRHSAFDEIRMALAEIRARGYRRIGTFLIQHDMDHPDDESRLGAVLAAQSRLGPDESAIPPLIIRASDSEEMIPKWFRQHRPDAVLSFHQGGYQILESAGIPVGTEVGFASLNVADDRNTDYLGKISGVIDSIPRQMVRAVDLIDLQVRHHVHGPVDNPTSTLIHPAWNEGQTLPRRA